MEELQLELTIASTYFYTYRAPFNSTASTIQGASWRILTVSVAAATRAVTSDGHHYCYCFVSSFVANAVVVNGFGRFFSSQP